MNIYTKTGDKGTTSLATGERVEKDDPRLEAYGTADELNSFVGLLRNYIPKDIDVQLEYIQNKLFNLGAELANAPGMWLEEKDVQCLEQWMDEIQSMLEPVHAFVLPGGSQSVALCHVCRTITRRLERQMVSLQKVTKTEKNAIEPFSPISYRFVNRLSDFWFMLAKKMAKIENLSLFLWKK